MQEREIPPKLLRPESPSALGDKPPARITQDVRQEAFCVESGSLDSCPLQEERAGHQAVFNGRAEAYGEGSQVPKQSLRESRANHDNAFRRSV